MTYEMFMEVVTEKFKNYLPQDYQDMEVRVEPVKKVNCILDGITLVGGEQERRILPTLYINHMYDCYMESNDLQGVLQAAVTQMVELMQNHSQMPTLDWENAKSNIVFQLVNTEQNKEMLLNMPHREFQDLSIIYSLVVSIEAQGIQNIKVDNSLAAWLGFDEEQLFNLATVNTKRILPPCIKSMNEMMHEMFSEGNMPAEMIVEEMPLEQTMWIITNNRNLNGAVSMLYEDKLHMLAQQMDTDLYILPSSTHEVIAVSASMGEPEELAQMVSEVNMSQVALEDRLSNQVYHYDKDLRKLTLATDTPNKSLSGVVSEPISYETKQSR